MKFAQFQNGNVGRIVNEHTISGIVVVPDYENLSLVDSEKSLAIFKAVTGIEKGFLDFDLSEIDRGFGTVAYKVDPRDPEIAASIKILDSQKDAGRLHDAFVKQFNLTPAEARHALCNIDKNYPDERSIEIFQSDTEIRCDAVCSYIRLVVADLEIARLDAENFRNNPGAMLSTFFDLVHERMNRE